MARRGCRASERIVAVRHSWALRGAVAVVFLVGLFGIGGCHRGQGDTGGPGGDGKKRGDGANAPIPVTVTEVAKQDMPIYLDGLGAVQAFNTATILAQASGQLIAVPFKEGDDVHAGDLIAQVDPRTYQATLDQAIAKKAQDEAQLASARLDLKRYETLAPSGYIDIQQVDQQRALVDQDAALVQADAAAIESDRVTLSYTSIRAPFAGVLGIRTVDVGNLVSSSNQTGIVTITQIKPIATTFTLPEQSLAQIRDAGGGPLTVVARDRDNQKELARGTLMAFDNQIDQTTGTIKLKASFANDDRKLWPGQFVNVRLLVRTQRDALTVPSQAVQLGPNGSFVYVVNDGPNNEHTVSMASVTTAQSESGSTVLTSGIKEGDKIVVDGQSRLQPGSKVIVTEVPANGAAPQQNGQTALPRHKRPPVDNPAPGGSP
jgi:multidrug efflux system membrane fusion protein